LKFNGISLFRTVNLYVSGKNKATTCGGHLGCSTDVSEGQGEELAYCLYY